MNAFCTKIFHLCAAGMALVAISACTGYQDDLRGIDEANNENIVFFPSSLTRAGDNSFESGDVIGVYASTNERGEILVSGNYAANEKYAYSENQFIQVGKGIQKYKGDGVYTINYYAVYPYNEYQDVMFTFTIDEDQSTHAKYTKNDLMMGYNSATTAETLVPLKFRHMLSQVVVNTAKAGLEGRNYTLTFLSDINKVKANLAKLTVIRSETNTKPIDIVMCPDGLNQYKAILPPQKMISKEVVVYIKMDGRTYLARLENNVSLHSGKSVMFELLPLPDSNEFILQIKSN